MKRTNKVENQWYLVCNGKTAKVVNEKNVAEARTMNVVIIPISADEAANILLLEKGEGDIV